jgi:hypothetical protein
MMTMIGYVNSFSLSVSGLSDAPSGPPYTVNLYHGNFVFNQKYRDEIKGKHEYNYIAAVKSNITDGFTKSHHHSILREDENYSVN